MCIKKEVSEPQGCQKDSPMGMPNMVHRDHASRVQLNALIRLEGDREASADRRIW